VLVLPADFVEIEKAFLIIKAWLDTEPEKDEAYKKRLDMLDKI
jgi:ribose 5-phosphate isomerase RpiB